MALLRLLRDVELLKKFELAPSRASCDVLAEAKWVIPYEGLKMKLKALQSRELRNNLCSGVVELSKSLKEAYKYVMDPLYLLQAQDNKTRGAAVYI